MDKHENMDKYICKNGHIKYCPKKLSIDICNICGTKEFQKVNQKHNKGEN